MKGHNGMTALQSAAYWNNQSCIDTIRDSVSVEVRIELLSTPLPQYNKWIHNIDGYGRAVSGIDELRAAARVKSALQTEHHSGM